MSLVKKARRQNKWYHISYCHSMISFPSLPVFWKPEYEINVNIDFKPFFFILNLPFLLLLVWSLAHLIYQLFASDFPFFPMLVHLRMKIHFIRY